MTKLDALRDKLEPGQVYRRADLTEWSNAVDRHLASLVDAGALQKLSGGLYYCPKKTVFGNTPPEDKMLVQAFLKDSRFLITSPNAYNSLGVETTQLYKDTVVYNHKRHGKFKLGNRLFVFRVKHYFPMQLSQEFLLVDLVNNAAQLAEDVENVLARVIEKSKTFDYYELANAVRQYGSDKTRKFFAQSLSDDSLRYA